MPVVEISLYELLEGQKSLNVRLKDGIVDAALIKGILVPGKLVIAKFDTVDLISIFCTHVLHACKLKAISACAISFDTSDSHSCDTLHEFIQQLSNWTPTRVLLLMSGKNGNINLVKRKINLILKEIFATGYTCVISNMDMLDQLPDQGILISEHRANSESFKATSVNFKTYSECVTRH